MMLGFIAGMIFHIGIFYWVTYVVVKYGSLPIYLGISAMVLLCAYLSLYTAIFAGGVVLLRNIPLLISAPILWTVLEYVRGQLLTGFPWEGLAYSQYLFRPLIQIVDITGTAGLTFLIVFVNVLLYEVCTKEYIHDRLWRIAAIMIILCSLGVYGFLRIESIDILNSKERAVPVRLIQGNIDQNIKWDPKFQKDTVDIYLSQSAYSQPVSEGLIIWPETAAPFYFQDANQTQQHILSFVKEKATWLILGSPSYQIKDGGMTFSNSAFLVDYHGQIAGQYDKVQLVPYGEYVPMRKIFPFISKLAVGVGDFMPGQGFSPVMMAGHPVGILICYEGIFPGAGVAYKRQGVELLVNITNDAWFGPTSAPFQHLSMTIFRAVENRLYLCRAANTGITTIISPTGQILGRTKLFERTSLKGEIKFLRTVTFYSTYGDIFAYSCIGMLFFIVIVSLLRRKR